LGRVDGLVTGALAAACSQHRSGTVRIRDRKGLAVRTGFRGLAEQREFAGRRRATRRRSWLRFAPLWAGTLALGTAQGAGWLDLRSAYAAVLSATPKAPAVLDAGVDAHFGICFTGGGYNCVVDGDTLWLEGTKIRIADVDAPETHQPRCADEKQRGDRATLRLQQLVNSGTVTLRRIARDSDRYGRKLRIVLAGGVNVGSTLVAEGLARPYAGGRRPWC
jgi:endonuclease YncB( thermonuclease family)